MSKKLDAGRNCHCRYNLTYHLVLVTKYRHPAITDKVFSTLEKHITSILEMNKCELKALNYDIDHVHIMFSAPPQVRMSTLVNNIKTVTSRMVRKEHSAWMSKFYWKPIFWSRSYYIGTIGEATIEIVERYIQNQRVLRPPIST